MSLNQPKLCRLSTYECAQVHFIQTRAAWKKNTKAVEEDGKAFKYFDTNEASKKISSYKNFTRPCSFGNDKRFDWQKKTPFSTNMGPGKYNTHKSTLNLATGQCIGHEKRFVERDPRVKQNFPGAKYEVRNKMPNGDMSVKDKPAYSFTTAGHVHAKDQKIPGPNQYFPEVKKEIAAGANSKFGRTRGGCLTRDTRPPIGCLFKTTHTHVSPGPIYGPDGGVRHMDRFSKEAIDFSHGQSFTRVGHKFDVAQGSASLNVPYMDQMSGFC